MPNEFLTRRAPARANSYDSETRTFDAVIASSEPVQRTDYEGAYREVLDLSGSLPASLPFLNGHQQRDAGNVIGRVQNIRREGESLVASIRLSARDEVRGIGQDISDGIITDISVGYRVTGTTVTEAGGVRTKLVQPEILKHRSSR